MRARAGGVENVIAPTGTPEIAAGLVGVDQGADFFYFGSLVRQAGEELTGDFHPESSDRFMIAAVRTVDGADAQIVMLHSFAHPVQGGLAGEPQQVEACHGEVRGVVPFGFRQGAGLELVEQSAQFLAGPCRVHSGFDAGKTLPVGESRAFPAGPVRFVLA
jgi:hypothetical protein